MVHLRGIKVSVRLFLTYEHISVLSCTTTALQQEEPLCCKVPLSLAAGAVGRCLAGGRGRGITGCCLAQPCLPLLAHSRLLLWEPVASASKRK